MKKLLTVCLALFALTAHSQNTNYEAVSIKTAETSAPDTTVVSDSTSGPVSLDSSGIKKNWVKEVRWPVLDTLLHSDSDTTYVINFWATWCRPCVAELPHFEALNRNYASQKVRIVLVSMDFVKDIEDRVIPFVERMKLANTVWLLDEPDANSWIEKVDAGWSGALPATLILNPSRAKRAFFEKALDYETLVRELSYFIEY
jgi:thiol-disulfide isomerase/thioredoxin